MQWFVDAFKRLDNNLDRKLLDFNNNLDDRIDQLESNFGNKFGKLEERFEKLEGRFDGLEGRFDKLEGRFDKLEKEFGKVEDNVTTLTRKVATLERTVKDLGTETKVVGNRVFLLNANTCENIRILTGHVVVITNELRAKDFALDFNAFDRLPPLIFSEVPFQISTHIDQDSSPVNDPVAEPSTAAVVTSGTGMPPQETAHV